MARMVRTSGSTCVISRSPFIYGYEMMDEFMGRKLSLESKLIITRPSNDVKSDEAHSCV